MQFSRQKKKKLKVFQTKLEDLVDVYEVKKETKPELEALYVDVEKCLQETSKQAREIGKLAAAVVNHKASIQNGTVALTEQYHMYLLDSDKAFP